MDFYIGFYAYDIIVHTLANQLLPQLLMEQFDTFLYNVDTLNICIKEFDSERINFDKLTAVRIFPNRAFVYAWNSYHSFFMEQFDTLLIQYRHIEHMHEGV